MKGLRLNASSFFVTATEGHGCGFQVIRPHTKQEVFDFCIYKRQYIFTVCGE